jgi:hypothetical protein
LSQAAHYINGNARCYGALRHIDERPASPTEVDHSSIRTHMDPGRTKATTFGRAQNAAAFRRAQGGRRLRVDAGKPSPSGGRKTAAAFGWAQGSHRLRAGAGSHHLRADAWQPPPSGGRRKAVAFELAQVSHHLRADAETPPPSGRRREACSHEAIA